MATKGRAPKRRKVVRKIEQIHVRVTADQKEELTEAATQAGMGVSTWMLSVSLERARGKPDKGGGA